MDHFQGITVEVISNGQVLDFYQDPDAAGTEENRARHHYIEALAGSTFQVKVTLTPQFNFYNLKAKDAVRVLVEIDGRKEISWRICKTKEYLQKKFSKRATFDHTFTGPRHFCTQTEQWMRRDYSFSNLILKETQDPGTPVKDAQNLGRIQVTVSRVNLEERTRVPIAKTPIATINEIPEKALKGRSIDTTVRQVDGSDLFGLTAKQPYPRLTNARPTPEPPANRTCPKSIRGETGKPVVFNIYYRSRRALQMLGCIPRSLSPEVPNPQDEAIAPGDAMQEVRDLRARLAILERSLQVKIEPTSAPKNLKRERDEEHDQGSFQRRRLAAKVEHVDLTGD